MRDEPVVSLIFHQRGYTALHYACMFRRDAVFEYLLSVNPNVKDKVCLQHKSNQIIILSDRLDAQFFFKRAGIITLGQSINC